MPRDPLAEKACIAYPHGDRLHPGFARSLARLVRYDAYGPRRLVSGEWLLTSETTNLPNSRNAIVRMFLEQTTVDWLWFVDTDETFPEDVLERLILSADPDERPILSGLVFAQASNRTLPVSPAPVVWDPEREDFVESMIVPDVRHWQVACAGAGCLLIHRSVLVAVGERHADDAFPWFKYAQHTGKDGKPDMMGEDFTFSLRAAALGFPSVVDTTIVCGHVKERELGARDFWQQLPPAMKPRRLLAVVPVRDEFEHTKRVVEELAAEVDHVLVVDNGSQPRTANWLQGPQCPASVLVAPEAGIHEMWNAGVEWAAQVAPAGFDLLIANNDVHFEPGSVRKVAQALADTPQLTVASLDYDGRGGEGIEWRADICGERYDRTGGIAGFAFVVRSEWFDAGYRFPSECRWWYGDNDLLLAVHQAGGASGIVLGARCEHLDGGGATTGGWSDPKRQEVAEAKVRDREAFMRRWSRIAGGPGPASGPADGFGASDGGTGAAGPEAA